ncbi:hypothetical protein BSKO_11806 [Bryopsis sp. KO-2023]|nr:hypothetical protein BSKO_11806 [Bryopsis sp. KO-2023]
MAASSTSAAQEGLGLLKEIKNLEDYLGELKHRSEKRLKELKYERKLMHEQKVNVIAELQKEIHLLKESNRTLKLELEHRKAENDNSKEVASLKEQIKTLEKGKGWLEQIAARKDGIIEELQNQIESSQPREASPSGGAREIERLALVLKDREHELVEVRRESNSLKAIVEDLHAKHRSQQQDLEDACHEAESLRGILSELDAQNNDQELMEASQEIDSLKCLTQELREALDEKMEDSEELEKVQEECQHLRSLVAEMKSQDSTRELNAIKQEAEDLRSTVAELREQNAKQSANDKHTEEVLAKLKTENEGLVKWIEDLNLSTRKTIVDVGRVESAKSDRIPSRPASIRDIPTLADPDVSQQLHMAYEEISALYDIRDDIMGEVQAMRREIFNPQAMRKMVKIVRDKELASLQKIKHEPRTAA